MLITSDYLNHQTSPRAEAMHHWASRSTRCRMRAHSDPYSITKVSVLFFGFTPFRYSIGFFPACDSAGLCWAIATCPGCPNQVWTSWGTMFPLRTSYLTQTDGGRSFSFTVVMNAGDSKQLFRFGKPLIGKGNGKLRSKSAIVIYMEAPKHLFKLTSTKEQQLYME